MTTEQARRLADTLMGLEDAKNDLISTYQTNAALKTNTRSSDLDMMDAGERWLENFDKLADFLHDEFERDNPEIIQVRLDLSKSPEETPNDG